MLESRKRKACDAGGRYRWMLHGGSRRKAPVQWRMLRCCSWQKPACNGSELCLSQKPSLSFSHVAPSNPRGERGGGGPTVVVLMGEAKANEYRADRPDRYQWGRGGVRAVSRPCLC